MKKVREYKSRIKSWAKGKTRSVEGSRPSTPGPAESRQDVAPIGTPQTEAPSSLGRDKAPAPGEGPIGPIQDVGRTPSLPAPASMGPLYADVTIHPPPTTEGPVTHVPYVTDPEVIATPGTSQASPHPPPTPAKALIPSGSEILGWIKSKGWENLKGLLDTLNQAATATGLGQVKTVIEGFVNCIGIYEEAAQGRKDYEELREQLEGIFKELKTYMSSSPVITTSIESICGITRSIQKEIEYIKSQRERPVGRRIQEAETDAENTLKCYQRIQAHLERLSRNANISAWVVVDQIATENRLRDLAPSFSACYNSEKALELKRRPCTEGTRTSVLAQMHQWMEGRNSGNIYWMSGMAGTGKTTIAYSLCEQLDTEANQKLCASFFCSRSLPECREVGRIIPSVAYQLAQCSRPFRYALSQATEKDSIAHTRLPQMQFDALIVRPFSDPKVREAFPTNMVVVIDALDECDDVKSTKLMLDVLLTKTKDLPIKFVVSSRPEPAIRDRMEKNGTWVDARVVLHELDSREVKTDIRTYLEAELDPIKPSDLQIDQLVARAGVLFIYAATVVRYVGYDDFGRDPQARLGMVLGAPDQVEKAPTNDIDDLYAIILRAAFEDPMLSKRERDNMKTVLDTAICARQPLSVEALNNLLKLGGIARVHAALRPLWSVLHVMGPNATVTTLHASFPDYLFDPHRSGAWHCDAAAHHHQLAQRCFECIRDTKPQFNICRLESSYLLDSEVTDLDERVQRFISAELSYACRYWSSHLEVAQSITGSANGLVPLLSQFLTGDLLLWMEVRNLTKTMSTTVAQLMTAKKWATRHDMTRDMIDLLTDAWRFTSTFMSNPVAQSTPHIYISMLPLLPLHSPIRKYYTDRFEGKVEVEGTALERRKDELLAEWKVNIYVRCMACSPDGTRIAVGGGSDDEALSGPLYILDAITGSLLHSSAGRFSAADHYSGYAHYSMAFSPDSANLVCGRYAGYISIWNVGIGEQTLPTFEAHDDKVTSILYSHDGSFLVSASVSDKTIRMWNPLTGKPAPTPLIENVYNVTCITLSSDDTLLVSGSDDGTICVRDVKSGQLMLNAMKEQEGSITAAAFSPDDSYFVSGSIDGTVVVWDTRTGQIMYKPIRDSGGDVLSISISPDGASIASTTLIDGVRIWDAASGKIVSQLGPYSEEAHSVVFQRASYSPDGTHIIFIRNVFVYHGILRLLDAHVATAAPSPLPGHTKAIASIDISPNGQHLVSGSYDATVCVWDLAQGTLLVGPLQGHDAGVTMVRFSPSGGRIVSCCLDLTIRQWDAKSGALYGALIRVESSCYPHSVSATYSPDDAYIVALERSGNLSIWDSSTCHFVSGPDTSEGSGGVCAYFSPEGTTVIAGYESGLVSERDVQNGQLVHSHIRHSYYGWSVFNDIATDNFVLSPNGLYYARDSQHGEIEVTNLHTGEQLPGAFQGHTGSVRSLRFSPDGTRLISGGKDKAVNVWSIESGQSLLGSLRGHMGTVSSVAFSLNGNYAVSASHDRVIRVWNVQPNELPGTDRGTEHAAWVLNDDGWVVSGGSRRLFWVPIDLRNSLMSPRNTMLLSRDGYVRLKFERARIGKTWSDCYRNG